MTKTEQNCEDILHEFGQAVCMLVVGSAGLLTMHGWTLERGERETIKKLQEVLKTMKSAR